MTSFANLPLTSSDAASQRLEEVMEEMADGHMPAILLFWQEFSAKMCRTVKAILREQDQRDLAADAEYVRDLAFECCWVIYERAPQWSNEDDQPWQWARPLLFSWVEDWLEQTGVTGEGAIEAELEAQAPDFGIFDEFGGDAGAGEAAVGESGEAGSGEASEYDFGRGDTDMGDAGDAGAVTDAEAVTDTGDDLLVSDTFEPEFTISGESQSLGDRFDEALGLRPKN